MLTMEWLCSMNTRTCRGVPLGTYGNYPGKNSTQIKQKHPGNLLHIISYSFSVVVII